MSNDSSYYTNPLESSMCSSKMSESLNQSTFSAHTKPPKKKPTKPRQPKLGLIRDIEKLWAEAKHIIEDYRLAEEDIDEYKKGLESDVSNKSEALLEAEAELKVEEDKFDPIEARFKVQQIEDLKLQKELEELEREILDCDETIIFEKKRESAVLAELESKLVKIDQEADSMEKEAFQLQVQIEDQKEETKKLQKHIDDECFRVLKAQVGC